MLLKPFGLDEVLDVALFQDILRHDRRLCNRIFLGCVALFRVL